MKTKNVLLYGLFAVLILFTISSCGRNADNLNEIENNFGAAPDEFGTAPDEFGAAPHFSEGLDENGFWQGVNVLDHVEMFNYEGLVIPADVHNVPEESIQAVIDDIRRDFAIVEQIMDRPVAEGDDINIDFVGSVDGVEFEGGNTFGEGHDVVVEPGQFIEGFLEQLVGHMPGAIVNVEVTFPETYFEASLQGAEALFVTTINHISGEIVPELTDEFIYTNFNLSHGVATYDELIADIRYFIQEDAVHRYINDYLATQVVVRSIPELLIRYHEQMLLHEYVSQAMQFNMNLEDLLELFGFETVEELLDDNRESIESEARYSLVMQAIAEDAGIIATVDDVTDFIVQNFGTDDISMFEEFYGMPWLKQFIRNQMVLDYIREQAVFA